MKRFIDQVAGQTEQEDEGSELKKFKSDSGEDQDAANTQKQNNSGSTPFSGHRGGRYQNKGGRNRDRNQHGRKGVAPGPTGQSLGMNALMNGEVQIKSVLNLKREMAGAVIGRGGSKVQKMREETGALIHVCPAVRKTDTERAVEITGVIEKVQTAEVQVYNLMLETDKEWTEVESSGPRLEIHILPEMVGCVMGRGGARVKALREELQVEIHVTQKKDDPDLQVVTVSGTAAKAHAADVRISEHLKEFEPNKSKMLLKRMQQADQGKKMDAGKGFPGGQVASGSMMMMPGAQLPTPQVQPNAQVLIQQPDGSYALAQVMIPGGPLPGAIPSAAPLGGGIMGQGGVQLVQPQVPGQLPLNFGMAGVAQDGNQFVQGLAGATLGVAATGLDMQQQQLGLQPALQGGLLKGQLPPSNQNAHQFGN